MSAYRIDGVDYVVDDARLNELILVAGAELRAGDRSGTPLELVARRAGVSDRTLARARRGERVQVVKLVDIVVRGVRRPLAEVLHRVENETARRDTSSRRATNSKASSTGDRHAERIAS